MKVGDKVRLVHSPEEGVIVQLKGNVADVEIEDGFVIPVMMHELVAIASEEQKHFHRPQDTAPSASQRPRLQDTIGEVCLVFTPFPHDDKNMQVHLLNRTSYTILFTYFEKSIKENKAVACGQLEPTTHLLLSDYSFAKAEHWPELHFQFLKFNKRLAPMEPVSVQYKFKAAAFFNKKVHIEELKKDGYLFELTSRERKIKADELLMGMTEKPLSADKDVKERIVKQGGHRKIDLHIDQLVDDHTGMSNSEMMRRQMAAFDKAINEAIMSGADTLKVIHGIGNGVLRTNVHKALSAMDNIWFEDADKDKFGFGATLVHIK